MSVQLSNGLSIPSLGFGTWQIKPKDAINAVYAAIKAGYRHIDCAHIYGNEKEVGVAIKRAIDEGIIKREDLWITSKVWNDDHADVAGALEVILNNLGVTYLDLLLIHWPVHWKKNAGTTPDASLTHASVWAQMEALVDAGKVRSIGVSNHSLEEVKEVYEAARIKPVMNQVECHPVWNQLALEEGLKKMNIKITAYSAFNMNEPDPAKRIDLFTHPTVVAIAKKHGKEPSQVLLRYHIDQGRCVIPKSITEERIQQNFGAVTFKLDQTDIDELNNIKPQVRGVNPPNWRGVPGPFFSD